ncbi:MAG: hypothetical protein KatS3mg058_0910 [Roseiflexus sp.]|nr:MAG: hypothetical protein KatS3mg058_0910 [Roseiflexus sp.]
MTRMRHLQSSLVASQFEHPQQPEEPQRAQKTQVNRKKPQIEGQKREGIDNDHRRKRVLHSLQHRVSIARIRRARPQLDDILDSEDGDREDLERNAEKNPAKRPPISSTLAMTIARTFRRMSAIMPVSYQSSTGEWLFES